MAVGRTRYSFDDVREGLEVDIEAAIASMQDACTLLRACQVFLASKDHLSLEWSEVAMAETITLLVQKAKGEGECGLDLLSPYPGRLQTLLSGE
jgi:hypothetical protein